LTPYVDFTYFLFLAYPVAIAIALGLLGLLGPRFILLASVGVLLFQVGDPLALPSQAPANLAQLDFLIAYALLSVGTVLLFGRIRHGAKVRWPFYIVLALALLPLVAVKAYPLVAGSKWLGLALAAPTTSGTSPLVDAIGFVGISYMTFRVVDVLNVINDGLVQEPPGLVTVASYVLFFPTFSAGPVDRYLRFANDLKAMPRHAGACVRDLERGISRIFQGFLYKFVLAYLVNEYALVPSSKIPGALGLAAYGYAYLLYLFFDFAGYSAFAIGVGHFFGISVPENFNAPFLSRNFKELWNRWHISLSTYLRDHVYRRFVLTAQRRSWFGGNLLLANYCGLFLTMFTMGLWHGLSPHFVVYGAFQGAMVVAADAVGRWNRQARRIPQNILTDVGGVALTLSLFAFSLLIFSGRLFD
jgi:membrane protein involved in D-alanine export